MKTKFVLAAFVVGLVILSFGACEGDKGDIGPAGPVGPEGPIGQAGVENCKDCHGSSQLITSKLFQWESSVHATGGHYERNTAECAGCHTSQGFLDMMFSGTETATMDIEDPLPQNCYTCHQVHQTYTDEDWTLTHTDPVTLWTGANTVDLGQANLCLNCHQTRRRDDPALPTPGDTDSLVITSPFWGPHHGAQGALFTGSSAFEIGTGYENSLHTTLVENACITCHMAAVSGANAAGGHTFHVISETGDLNMNGCVQCHSDAGELQMMVDGTQAEIETLLEELKVELEAIGILSFQFGADRATAGTWDPTHVGALWNYLYVEEDKSHGVHNYKYAKTLLENSIDALQ